uniref:Uncharacterized protein n=1 Tax=Naja naja TaxID=35670 RepID=A0A8C6VH38_NAJNA
SHRCPWSPGTFYTSASPGYTRASGRRKQHHHKICCASFSKVPLNLILDSMYVSQIVSTIFDSYLSPSIEPDLLALFCTLQSLIAERNCPFLLLILGATNLSLVCSKKVTIGQAMQLHI